MVRDWDNKRTRAWEKGSAEEFICGRANNHPLLTRAEEIEWIPRAQKGDQKAWTKVVRCNQRLIMQRAHKFLGNGLDFSDLIQEGNIGMKRAIEKWDPLRGIKFSTYAVWWIEQAIRRAICYKSRIVRLPVGLEAALVKVQREWYTSLVEDQETVTSKELSDRTGISLEKVERCKLFFQKCDSLDGNIYDDNELTNLGMHLTSNTRPPDEEVESTADKEAVHVWIEQLLPKDKLFIKQRFGFSDCEPKTRLQLAQFYSTTEEDIHNWELRVLAALRKVADPELINMAFQGLKPTKKEIRRAAADDTSSTKAKRKPSAGTAQS